MQKELKERKQCSYKPSSVPIPSETIRAPVIYLVPESPLGSSTLPSAAARRQSDEPPSICGLHELTAPRWHSLAITRQLVVSYTTFSPLLSPTVGISGGSGYFLLPTPTVTNSFYFRKWDALRCPDFPLAPSSRECQRQAGALLSKCKDSKKVRLNRQFLWVFKLFSLLGNDFTAFSSQKTDIPVIFFSYSVHIRLHIKKF